jgi:dihydrofolate synthase/folylpolyglutamate synthase
VPGTADNNISPVGNSREQRAQYQAAIDWIFGRINYERAKTGTFSARDFKLDRMGELLQRLDNPQDTIPVVHVAGTKGKGSTSTMAAAVLTEAGYRTGLFTSPHLQRFEERLTVDGQEPDQSTFLRIFGRCRQAVEAMDLLDDPMPPTFFEIATALAWLYFTQQQCDIVVLEVGLGGRLDSTNVCRPKVCVITSISLDHTTVLGNTLELIAAEKAGIIKHRVPVISGASAVEARREIESTSRSKAAELWQLNEEITVQHVPGESFVSVRTPLNVWQQIPLPLPGQHQARNLALVLAVVDRLNEQGWKIADHHVRDGLSAVICPLRIEVVAEDPTVIVDAAHNEASCRALVDTLNASFPLRPRTLIVAATGGKDVESMLHVLLPEFDSVILTQYAGNPRFLPLGKLQSMAESIGHPKMMSIETIGDAWRTAIDLDARLICATGSFFFASEFRKLIRQQDNKPAD